MTSPVLTQPEALAAPIPFSDRSASGKFVFFGTFGLLLFGPLAFGTTEPWSIFVQQTGAAILLFVWLFSQVRTGALEIFPNPLFAPMLAFAGIVVIQLLTRRTSYRYATYSHAMTYMAYGILCFLTVQCLRRTRQVKLMATIFSAYGFVVAMFAVLQSVSSNGKVYWLRTPRFGGFIYGPYVNRNHYAGLMEMLVPIPLVLALSQNARGGRRGMALIAAAVMASTIFLSGSRGGMLAFTAEMCVLAAVLTYHRRGPGSVRLISGFLAVLIIMLLWLGGSSFIDRVATLDSNPRHEISAALRLTIAADAVRMFSQRPVLGWGLGTFAEVYPQFQSVFPDATIDQAHNDYLQLLVEMGSVGFAIILWFIVSMYRHAIAKIRGWDHDLNGSVALAALLGCTGILVHSFVDFNLQIPSNAALFYVLATVAAMPRCFGVLRRRSRSAVGESWVEEPVSQGC